MLFYIQGTPQSRLNQEDLQSGLKSAFDKLGEKKRILVLPPDFTRYHSQAGQITKIVWDYYQDKVIDILPAIGTHYPMTREEISKMYPGVPIGLFRVHDWRNGS